MFIRTQVSRFVLFLAVLLTSPLLQGQVVKGGSTLPEPARATDPRPFYAAVSRSFHVPEGQVRRLADRGLPAGQVVVVYFMAGHSMRQPTQILADRRAGKSWREIAMTAGLEPESFYSPLADTRAPLVNVYALYRVLPRDRWTWKRMPLQDSDIESLVSLRFLAELEGEQWPDVLRLRAQGHDFVNVRHFLLTGQQTAQRVDAPAAEVLPS